MSQLPPRVQAAQVEQALQLALSPVQMQVHDDSAAHAGHAGAREGSHFNVRIVSSRFSGVGRLARHRLVYDSLGSLSAQHVHALAIVAKAPGEA